MTRDIGGTTAPENGGPSDARRRAARFGWIARLGTNDTERSLKKALRMDKAEAALQQVYHWLDAKVMGCRFAQYLRQKKALYGVSCVLDDPESQDIIQAHIRQGAEEHKVVLLVFPDVDCEEKLERLVEIFADSHSMLHYVNLGAMIGGYREERVNDSFGGKSST